MPHLSALPLDCLCLRCGHVWYRRSPQLPRFCPYCHAKDWDVVPTRYLTTLRDVDQHSPQYQKYLAAGYTLASVDARGRACLEPPPQPEPRVCQCVHCRHVWEPRVVGRPVRCPTCKRANWDMPLKRIRKTRAERQAEEDAKTLQAARRAAGTDPDLLAAYERIRTQIEERARARATAPEQEGTGHIPE